LKNKKVDVFWGTVHNAIVVGKTAGAGAGAAGEEALRFACCGIIVSLHSSIKRSMFTLFRTASNYLQTAPNGSRSVFCKMSVALKRAGWFVVWCGR